MGELCKDCRCQRSVHVLQALVFIRLVHQLSDDIHHLYDELCTRHNGFYDLLDYPFQLYEKSQLNFVKDATSSGTDDFCKGMFNNFENRRYESFVRVRITALFGVFKCVHSGLDPFGFDLVEYLGDVELDDFGAFCSRHDT